MSKYQEALDSAVDSGISMKDWTLLKELVEKATPKARSVEHSGQRSPDGASVVMFFKYYCPCCKSRISEIDKFCQNCGQRLDWSEE